MDDNPVPVIRSYAVTTARDHNTKIDLSKSVITVYGDRGYFDMTRRESMAAWTGLSEGISSPWNP